MGIFIFIGVVVVLIVVVGLRQRRLGKYADRTPESNRTEHHGNTKGQSGGGGVGFG